MVINQARGGQELVCFPPIHVKTIVIGPIAAGAVNLPDQIAGDGAGAVDAGVLGPVDPAAVGSVIVSLPHAAAIGAVVLGNGAGTAAIIKFIEVIIGFVRPGSRSAGDGQIRPQMRNASPQDVIVIMGGVGPIRAV